MKRRIIPVILVFSFVCILSRSAMAEPSSLDKVKTWGDSVQKYVTNPIEEDTAVIQSLEVAKNNEIILPKVEIEQAKDFYIAAGYEEKEASELAVTYVKEINTLYQEAIKNGYTVTEDEISAYIEQMKKQFKSAENKEEIYNFINSFENEDAYWKFQFEMLKKDLPIQKYVSDKEKNFIDASIPNNTSTRTIDNSEYADKIMEAQEKWIDEFENMKDTAESNYSYTVK